MLVMFRIRVRVMVRVSGYEGYYRVKVRDRERVRCRVIVSLEKVCE